jgi:hypothetical protein
MKSDASTSSKVLGGHNMVKAQHSEWKSIIAGENVSPSMSITIPNHTMPGFVAVDHAQIQITSGQVGGPC